MPTLVQINATCNWGSTGRIAENIGLLAKQQGWNCYIAHGSRYVRESQLRSIAVGSKKDDFLHALKSKILGGHGLGSACATRKFIKELQQIKPDIVHLHNIHGYYINYPLLFTYLKEASIPVVWTLHDCWSMTGHCTHFDNIGCERWKTGCFDCPQKRAHYGALICTNCRRNWNLKKQYFTSLPNLTLVPVSHWLEGIVKLSYLKDADIRVINNGIDLSIFHPAETALRAKLSVPKGKKIILGVATSWDEEKGLPEFIKLSSIPEFQIVLIGLLPEQVKKMPREIIAVERTFNQNELAEYYSIADVLVNPTYNDTFPTVNMEALACGTPVVTYRTGGSPEILSAETGAVVNRGDYDALLEAIRLVTSKGKESYSNACIQRASEKYNKDERFMDYIKLYESLLGM